MLKKAKTLGIIGVAKTGDTKGSFVSILNNIQIPLASVNENLSANESFSESVLAEWADLDATSTSIPAGDSKALAQALSWVDKLPPEYQRRVIYICAERIGIDADGLPDVVTLRQALDRPTPPRGIGRWQDMADSLTRTKRRWTTGMQRWTNAVADQAADYVERSDAWLVAYGRWSKLAHEVAVWMREHVPVDASGEEIEHMSPRGRGTALMCRHYDDVCDIAASLAKSWQTVDRLKRELAGVDADAELTPEQRERMCPLWWRGVLRCETREARQYWQWALGAASAFGARYCSDFSLARYMERQAKARQFAERMEVVLGVIVNDDGERQDIVKSLLKIREESEQHRLIRLYVNSKGVAALGNRLGLKAVFLTLTLPPEYHSHPKSGFNGRKWICMYGPKMAVATMQTLWARLRERIRRQLYPLGIRVTEVHKDGCPHMHIMLWVSPEKVGDVKRHLDKVFPWQAGQKGRLRVIDKNKYEKRNPGKCGADAASYLLKYLTKSMQISNDTAEAAGVHLTESKQVSDDFGGDHHDVDALSDFDRVRAQSSEMGIRRYGLIGLHGIQRIFQKVRTAGEEALEAMPMRAREARALMDEAGRLAETASEARKAGDVDTARQGDQAASQTWADVLVKLGAVGVDEAAGTLVRATDRLRGMYEPIVNRYGRTGRRWAGISDTSTSEEWAAPRYEIRRKNQRKTQDKYVEYLRRENERAVVASCPRYGADAPACIEELKRFWENYVPPPTPQDIFSTIRHIKIDLRAALNRRNTLAA